MFDSPQCLLPEHVKHPFGWQSSCAIDVGDDNCYGSTSQLGAEAIGSAPARLVPDKVPDKMPQTSFCRIALLAEHLVKLLDDACKVIAAHLLHLWKSAFVSFFFERHERQSV